MACGVSGQGPGGPTVRVGVECGVCVEQRCPFEVKASGYGRGRFGADLFCLVFITPGLAFLLVALQQSLEKRTE